MSTEREPLGEEVVNLLPGIDPEQRKELSDFYKWIVNLAVFVITASVGLATAFSNDLRWVWALTIGWLLLALCIYLNMILVRKLVQLPILEKALENATPDEAQNLPYMSKVHLGSYSNNIRVFSRLQSLAFAIGALIVIATFALNLLLRP